MNQVPPVYRSSGATAAEQYLKKLCDRSFLSLWSYSGVYRDQGKVGKAGDGKEVCDLLVVFQNHILIFSDKDCVFPDTDNLELDWARWFRRAIQKSAEQLWGAERWIKSHPDRLFLDPGCTQKFPLTLPDPATAQFHRILVAHGVSDRCRKELGGSGSLMIWPDIVGNQHIKSIEDGGRPFAVGQIDTSKGYIHIFDDTSLGIVMEALDTITDFVTYLTKKERFIKSGRLSSATGEEELLAYYLRTLDSNREHDFVVPPEFDFIFLDEGLWEEWATSDRRKLQLKENKISYSWDMLLEKFFHHVFTGTSLKISHPTLAGQDKLFRLFAREDRTRRRLLAKSIYELIFNTPVSQRGTRVVLPSNPGDPYYVFLVLPRIDSISYEQYRETRGGLLDALCRVVKLKFPDAEDILGIATETGNAENRSEDAVYLDARDWTEESQADAQSLHENFGLLSDTKMFKDTIKEFPDLPPKQGRVMKMPSIQPKGRERNSLCPCGSGKKYKKCCAA